MSSDYIRDLLNGELSRVLRHVEYTRAEIANLERSLAEDRISLSQYEAKAAILREALATFLGTFQTERTS